MEIGSKVKPKIINPNKPPEWSEGVIEDFWCCTGVRINVTKSDKGVLWVSDYLDNVEML